MNLLPASVAGHETIVEGHAISLRARYPALAGPRVQLGIRPEFAALSRSEGLPVQVTRIEDLGRRRLARVMLGGRKMVATVPNALTLDGAEAFVRLDPDNLHVFVDDRRVVGERLGNASLHGAAA